MKKLHLILTCLCLWLPASITAQSLGLSATTPVSLSKINTTSLEEAVPFMTFDGQRIYFTRTNDQSAGLLKNNVLHEIWYADLQPDGQFTVTKAPKPLNAGLNSAVIGFNRSGSTLYLFGTYNKLFENQKGVSFSKFENDKWSKPEKLKIPALQIEDGFYGLYMHTDEKTLLISKGKAGNEDLFVAVKNANGSWSEPMDLGPQINTSDFEISPYITADLKHLFFSRGSTGAGTDIYHAERQGEGWTNWSKPEKLMAPVNSEAFDAYFSMLSDSTIVFSSNRAGSSDIYLAKLKVVPLGDSSSSDIIQPVEHRPTPTVAKTNLKTEEIESFIFFDFDKFKIPANQEPLLESIVAHLQTYPHLTISIGGHTDHIDTEDFNQELSDKRALEVSNYLIRKGIAKTRIRTNGYGELLPIANNHHRRGRKLNRRVRIKWIQTVQ